MRIPVVLLAVAVLISGCASGAPAEPESPQSHAAREHVAVVARDLSHRRYEDIDFVARAFADEGYADPMLIGIAEKEAATREDAFGSLQFLSPAVADETVYPAKQVGPFCFSVDFSYYGWTSAMTDWDGVSGIDPMTCPENPTAVTPPADENVYPVLAANALEAATSVLMSLGSPLPSPESIAASITELLEAPADPLQSAAPPSVAIEDGAVGVAMGSADDCMLLKFANGIVEQLYAAPVLLQPGELGCQGSTALYPDLSSPH